MWLFSLVSMLILIIRLLICSQVLWGNDYLRQDRSTEYPPCRYGSIDLVSSDATGHIIVWDVTLGQQVNILQEGSKPVAGVF